MTVLIPLPETFAEPLAIEVAIAVMVAIASRAVPEGSMVVAARASPAVAILAAGAMAFAVADTESLLVDLRSIINPIVVAVILTMSGNPAVVAIAIIIPIIIPIIIVPVVPVLAFGAAPIPTAIARIVAIDEFLFLLI
jgi:hypothetical protein